MQRSHPCLLAPLAQVDTCIVSHSPLGVQEICSHATQNKEHSRTFLRVLEALVMEFNPETAASCGLTWAQHEQCRASFEETCLRQIFEAGVLLAMAVSPDQDAATVAGSALNRCSCVSSCVQGAPNTASSLCACHDVIAKQM